jgi:phthiocerol/phenolphthiocerol synthesis type-I polyketide synthase E
VHGFYALDAALADKKPDFGILFSSNASVLGGLGFGAYAAANTFLDHVGNMDRPSGACQWMAINWDGWITPDMSSQGESGWTDPYGLQTQDALQALMRVIGFSTAPQLAVSATDLNERVATWVRQRRKQSNANGSGIETGSLAVGKIAPRNELERTIGGIWKEVLGVESVGVQDQFLDLGGDSLIGLRVLVRLQELFKVRVDPEFLLGPDATIAGLAVEVVTLLAVAKESVQ